MTYTSFIITIIIIIIIPRRVTACLCFLFSLFQAILFLATAGLYLSGRDEYLGFLVLCLALSWVNVLYFSRGEIHMGIYSVMIQKVGHAGWHDTVANITAYTSEP